MEGEKDIRESKRDKERRGRAYFADVIAIV